MAIRDKINNIRKKFYNRVTDYKFARICTMTVLLLYLPLIIIGVIIAALFGPDGYTIWTHWISDLGGIQHTPAPYLYDLAAITAGALTIPLTFYTEKLLAPMPQSTRECQYTSRLRLRLGSYAFFFSIIGNLGYIGVGIFSEDRNYFSLHNITSSLAFGGFSLGAFFMGLLIVLYNTKIPKLIGIYGVFGPLITIIVFLYTGNPLWEWILLISILIWVIPLALTVFHKQE